MKLITIRNGFVFLLLLPLLLLACDEDPTDPKPEVDDDILEKAFLHVSGIATSENTTPFYAFSRVTADTTGANNGERRDIGMSLFNRFTHYPAPIRLFSTCTFEGYLRHPNFEKSGVLVTAGSVTRLSTTRAVLYMESWLGPLAAVGMLLELELANGVWSVVREETLWIS
jgi:hypothetical protein